MTGPEKPREDESRPVNELFSLTYEELRRLAASARRTHANPAITTTALVHEAWVKLKGLPDLTSESHFKAIAAKAMRQILVDEARRRSAQKRGGAGEINLVPLDEAQAMVSCDRELLALDDCLKELADLSPRQAQIVEDLFFGGLSAAEIAALLDVSESTVLRDWRAAKAWLKSRVRKTAE
ncbi:MAG TPA: ECF-type sigma factor [Bryobacteraceae bacterium]|jgi:RNA polymerase sigma factor (TIGR02999 family)